MTPLSETTIDTDEISSECSSGTCADLAIRRGELFG
jgi:hypothetical protein